MVTFQPFGTPQILSEDGRAFVFPRKSCAILLALLGYSNRPVERVVAARILWPEALSESSRSSLRNTLSQLRSIVPAGTIVETPDGLAVDQRLIRFTGIDDLNPFEFRDFFEGSENEWVIDQRLIFRREMINCLIVECEQTENLEKRLQLSGLASRLDPLDVEAHRVHLRSLQESNQADRARVKRQEFRSRFIGQFGCLPAEESSSQPDSIPLISAAEWLADRSPNSAAEYLIATGTFWSGYSIKKVLNLHDHVISLLSPDASARFQLFSQRSMHCWSHLGLRGHFESIEEQLNSPIAEEEVEAAANLRMALAYGYLSSGQFSKAVDSAERAVAKIQASRTRSSRAIRTLLDGQIISLHANLGKSGDESSSKKIIDRYREIGSPLENIAAVQLEANLALQEGKFSKCADGLQQARDFYRVNGAERAEAWVQIDQCMLHLALNDESAVLREFQGLTPGKVSVIGHSAYCLAEDIRAIALARLGELLSAAEAYHRSRILRRKLGTVASSLEQSIRRNDLQKVRDDLSDKDWNTAKKRAQQSISNFTRFTA